MEAYLWGKCKRGDGEFYGLLRWEGRDLSTEVDTTSPLFEEMRGHHNDHSMRGHNGYKVYLKREDLERDEEVELIGLSVGIVGIGSRSHNARIYITKEMLGLG